MISLFRIDFRLLHYQTSQVWPKKLDINMIVVANDAVIQDPLRMSLMKMSAPANCGLKILSVQKAGLFLMDPKNERRRIELLVETPKDALRIIRSVPGIQHLNVALMKGGPGKKMVCPSLAFAPEDYDDLRSIVDLGVKAESYVTPDERPVSITKYL
ncbi:PTS sugar transporter subunit IIB [[Clostridium] innocuum]|nr:PTS sugar transporter subunit IIB [[Clostridium] innocuum]